MFEVGFTEIILILGIALVVLGPEKLPKVAADIGRWVGRARAMARQFTAQLDEEVVKADRDWTKPAPPPKPRSRTAAEDVDASPNRVDPAPSSAPPADAGAAPAGQATQEREKRQPDPGTDSP